MFTEGVEVYLLLTEDVEVYLVLIEKLKCTRY
jgi:hypothetical protein